MTCPGSFTRRDSRLRPFMTVSATEYTRSSFAANDDFGDFKLEIEEFNIYDKTGNY
jgi:hypothetical protein